MTADETREARIKRDSWTMARTLVALERISLQMALYGLKESGHSLEEIKRFTKEVTNEQG